MAVVYAVLAGQSCLAHPAVNGSQPLVPDAIYLQVGLDKSAGVAAGDCAARPEASTTSRPLQKLCFRAGHYWTSRLSWDLWFKRDGKLLNYINVSGFMGLQKRVVFAQSIGNLKNFFTNVCLCVYATYL